MYIDIQTDRDTYIDVQTDRGKGRAYKRTYTHKDEEEVCIGHTIHNGIFLWYIRG